MGDHHSTRWYRVATRTGRAAGFIAVVTALAIVVAAHPSPASSPAALADESRFGAASPVAAPADPTAGATATAEPTVTPLPSETPEAPSAAPAATATAEPSPGPMRDPTATAAIHSEQRPGASSAAADESVSPPIATPTGQDRAVALAAAPAASPVAATPTAEAPTVTVRIERADVAFGLVSGTGVVDPTVTGVTARADETGASYVKEGAVVVTIVSDGPWSGSCVVRDGGHGATAIPDDQGRLAWRLHGTTEWTAFPMNPAEPGAGCFAKQRSGTTTYVFDLRVRVEQTDAPGPFTATIRLSAAPAAE